MRLPSASWIPLAISLVITRGFCYDPVDVEGYFPAWTSPFGDNTPINFRPGKHDHQFCGVMRSASDAPSDNFPIYRTY
ncbi:Ecp24-2 [Fulvia fulva]|nr:extracellular protein 24-2 [Fulvia fulva]KAK4630169.1 Ecp24-2 [Fulvia fulva]